eukprot:5181853-Prymnesium_polylepis.2
MGAGVSARCVQHGSATAAIPVKCLLVVLCCRNGAVDGRKTSRQHEKGAAPDGEGRDPQRITLTVCTLRSCTLAWHIGVGRRCRPFAWRARAARHHGRVARRSQGAGLRCVCARGVYRDARFRRASAGESAGGGGGDLPIGDWIRRGAVGATDGVCSNTGRHAQPRAEG